MDKTNVRKISSQLLEVIPYGTIQEIADETGMVWDSVNQILRGKWTNKKVVRLAIEKVKALDKDIDSLMETIEKIEAESKAA